AVYLFNGLTGALISSLVGSHINDFVGGDITVLSNGNYLLRDLFWNTSRGAATWCSASTGVSGVVSDTNSLVGTDVNDRVGQNITFLSSGNYLLTSSNGSRGAVTWNSAATGVRGVVSEANSLVGSNVNDAVGNSGIFFLSNGNYVVLSSLWNG